jgi:hypothetical protein
MTAGEVSNYQKRGDITLVVVEAVQRAGRSEVRIPKEARIFFLLSATSKQQQPIYLGAEFVFYMATAINVTAIAVRYCSRPK